MKIIISGGGTGGHIYPALALIRTIKKEHPDTEFLYIGTQKGLESTIVPRSGCNIIIPKAINTSSSDGAKPFFMVVIYFWFSERNFAKKAIMASFINSDGWIENAPTPIQLLEPFLSIPIPGIKTSTNKAKQTIKRSFAQFLHVQ